MERPLPDVLLLVAVDTGARYRTRGPVHPVLAGAAVCQRILDGRPLGRAGAGTARAALRAELPDALTASGIRLSGQGVLTPLRHKVFGLFPRHGYRIVDRGAWERSRRQVRTAVTPRAVLGPDEAALAALAAVSGLARSIAPPGSPEERARHLNGLVDVMGPELTAVVQAVRYEYRRRDSDAQGPFIVPESDPEGFGDATSSGADGGDGDDGGDGGGGGGE